MRYKNEIVYDLIPQHEFEERRRPTDDSCKSCMCLSVIVKKTKTLCQQKHALTRAALSAKPLRKITSALSLSLHFDVSSSRCPYLLHLCIIT